MSSEKRRVSMTTMRRFLLIFIPLYAIISVALYIYYDISINSYEEVIKEKTVNEADHITKLLLNENQMVNSDIMYLSRLLALQRYINTGSDENLESLQTAFKTFSSARQVYDQIRYIDSSGMEIVRVNYNAGNPVILSVEELQNKSDRYYFREAIDLDMNEIYISPMDLNIENGEIEIPLKPMIRIGMPIFDSEGNKRGIVIVNYRATELVQSLELPSSKDDLLMLVNTDGYWLFNPDKSKEWGFMYPDRSELTFGNEFTDEWNTILASDAGQFFSGNGLFTFRSIYPLVNNRGSGSGATRSYEPGIDQFGADEFYWKVIVFVPSYVLDKLHNDVLATYSVIYIILILISGAGAFFGARLMVKRKQAEEALIRMNEELEDRVEARTAELKDINEKLIQEVSDRKLAEDANNLKTAFLASMSHEIRNPLNAVLGFSELMMDGIMGDISEEQKEGLNDIHTSGKHLLDLINDLLDLSKIEAGKMEFKPENTNLAEVIDESTAMLGSLIEAKQHTLTIEIADRNLQVWADTGRVRQVVLNLLSNAIKYTPNGGAITIETSREGEFCRTVVSDNGTGIKDEDKPRLFKVYAQADTIREENLKGTGLGLALTKQFVEAMGGEVGMESEYGKGSRFFFTLPCGQGEDS